MARKLASVAFATALLLLALVGGISWEKALSSEREARRLLSITNGFTVGRTTLSETRELTSAYTQLVSSSETNGQGDAYRSFVFDNANLAQLKLSSYRRFVLRFTFHGGVLAEKNGEASVEGDCRVSVTERSSESSDDPHHFSTVRANYDQPVAVAHIIDDIAYSAPLRAKDWQFSLEYLGGFRRCRDVRTLLPALFQQSR